MIGLTTTMIQKIKRKPQTTFINSKSIIPGIVFHTLIDLIAFIWALFNIEKLKEILEYNIFEDGINSLFLILITIALVSMLLTIISLLKLKKLNAYNIN